MSPLILWSILKPVFKWSMTLFQGVGEIIRSSETIFGDGTEGLSVEDEVERDTFDLTIDFMEARMLNKSAGEEEDESVMLGMVLL